MIKQLYKKSIMVSDTNGGDEDFVEPQIIVSYYEGDQSISLMQYDGQEVGIPARMIKEVIKAMQKIQP